MSHVVILPVVLPAFTAALLLLAARHSLFLQRIISIGATALLSLLAVVLFAVSLDGDPRPYRLGDWPAPFGIILVADRLSGLMVLLTAFLALLVIAYAACGWDQRGRHFHPLFQFQLMGINGAFLTGDIFNLFVFFEVLLIASYGLLLHGGGSRRLGAGFQYVAINLVGSTLFLVAVALIYSVTGTLNMADLALKVPLVDQGDVALLRTGALLLLAVFALKASLVPLHWWLPGTYAAATAPVAALFAILTKVGAYSIIRVFTLAFGPDAGPVADIAAPWIVPAALATLVIGFVGLLASRTMLDLVCFSVIGSMGTLLIPVGLFTATSLTAALYYLVHSTLVTAALFLLVDLVAQRRGVVLDALEPAPPFPQEQLLAGLFFLAGIALVGMPPLSGFMGKLLILDATRDAAGAGWIWLLILATSLLGIAGFARAGSDLFWKKVPMDGQAAASLPGRQALPIATAAAILLGTGLVAAFAGPVVDQMAATAEQILDPQLYIRAVLGEAAASRPGGD